MIYNLKTLVGIVDNIEEEIHNISIEEKNPKKLTEFLDFRWASEMKKAYNGHNWGKTEPQKLVRFKKYSKQYI